MRLRKGKKDDMFAVLELIKELAVFEKEPDAVVVTVDDLVRDGFGESPLFHTFVAEMDSEIVGIALYYYRYSTWKGKTIHLEDLIVKEKMRGTGEFSIKLKTDSCPIALNSLPSSIEKLANSAISAPATNAFSPSPVNKIDLTFTSAMLSTNA